jgi:hypothetical protein
VAEKTSVHVAEKESNLAETSVHDQETSDQLPEEASSLAIESITVEDVDSTTISFTEAAAPDTLTEVKHVEEQEEEAEQEDTGALETAADIKEPVEAIGSIEEDDSLPEKKAADTAVSEPITAVSEPMTAVPEPSTAVSEPSPAVPEPPTAVPEPITAGPELAPVHQPGKTSHELSPKPEEKKARSPSPSVVVIGTIQDSPRASKEASPVASIGVIEEDSSPSSLRSSKEASPAASPLTNGVAAAAEAVNEKEASPAASPLTNGVAAAEKEASPGVSSLKTVEDTGEEDVEVIGTIDED